MNRRKTRSTAPVELRTALNGALHAVSRGAWRRCSTTNSPSSLSAKELCMSPGEIVMRKLIQTIDRRTNQFVRDVVEPDHLGLVPVEFSTHAPGSARELAVALKCQLEEWGPELLGDSFGAQHAAEMVRTFLDAQRTWVKEPLRTARELKRLGLQPAGPV